jgi:RNA recognition motif-containing protein
MAQERKMNIYSSNIPRETSEADIREVFEKYGEVSTVTMIKDKYTNTFKGFAFIEMPKKEEAEEAIKHLDGAIMGDRSPTRLSQNPNPVTARKDTEADIKF